MLPPGVTHKRHWQGRQAVMTGHRADTPSALGAVAPQLARHRCAPGGPTGVPPWGVGGATGQGALVMSHP